MQCESSRRKNISTINLPSVSKQYPNLSFSILTQNLVASAHLGYLTSIIAFGIIKVKLTRYKQRKSLVQRRKYLRDRRIPLTIYVIVLVILQLINSQHFDSYN